MRSKFHIITAIVLIVTGCGQNKKADKFTALPFPEVSVPGMMTERGDVSEYLAMNFWNGITDPAREYPCDSVLVSGVKLCDVDQAFANWTYILDAVSREKADKAVSRLYDRAWACEKKDSSSNVFETFNEMVYKYFYDPNSPVRNEDNYHVYVRKLELNMDLDPAVRGKYEFEAVMTGKNRAGTVAADFRFSDKNGRIRTLHGIKAPFILLFFSNPGCEACMNIITVLKEEPSISEMIASGKLAVLNIYIDEDIQAWRDYMPIYPDSWYNGFDPDFVLRNDTIYNIRAIPSLYLLDKDKRVILKDAPENKLFEKLVYLTKN